MGIKSYKTTLDKHKVKVAVNYFTVKMKNRRPLQKIYFDADELLSKNYEHCGKKLGKVNGTDRSISPTITTSVDSFHSCHSSLSFLPIKQCHGDGVCKDPSPLHRARSPKMKPIRNVDLAHQVTMVNAIFLGKDEFVPEDRPKRTTTKDKHVESLKSKQTDTKRSLNISTPICTEAYACSIDRGVGLKPVSELATEIKRENWIKHRESVAETVKTGDNKLEETSQSGKTTKPRNEEFESNCIGIQEDLSSKQQQNTLPEADPRKDDRNVGGVLKFHKSIQTVNTISDKKCPQNDLVNTATGSDTKNDSLSDRNIFKCAIVQNKHTINHSREVNFLEPINVRTSSKIISPESDEAHFKSKPVPNDNENPSEKIVLNISKGGCNSKIVVAESYLKTLIKESLEKIKNKENMENHSRNHNINFSGKLIENSSVEESEEESDVDNGYDDLETYETDHLDGNREGYVFSSRDYGENSIQERDDETENYNPLACEEKPKQGEERYSSLLNSDVWPLTEKNCAQRKAHERQCYLPVIKEETSISLLDESPAEDLDLDYCLIDGNGRPIQLFDKKGLPLTDRCGRPLRSAKGQFLMSCDQDGIPLVDYDLCTIYDMFGRTPRDYDFDPSMAPKMPSVNRLMTCDGKPLVLFDAEERPLTSVSGTMLVDSSGRGLIRLATKLDDADHT